ncbi:hypothetical protein [Haliea salexigens]|uniref:hypothetical protein n=1 Tax=Haliea salexigens TaxID=287487 RepID=UPI001183AAC6|nr:hypothetical protein [Haliea salexigens]
MPEYSVLELVASVGASVVAGLLLIWLSRIRDTLIRSSISDLEHNQDFLERIARGNVQLIRSGFKVLCFSLAVGFSVAAALLTITLFPVPDMVAVTVWGVSIGLCGGAAWINAWIFRSIVRLNDLKSSKATLALRRKKLESKL